MANYPNNETKGGIIQKQNKKTSKTVLVTGGSSGIGLAIAKLFAHNNWRVICHYYDSEIAAKQLSKEVKSNGGICRVVQGDLSNQEGVADFMAEIEDERISSLINNAGSYVASKHMSDLNFSDLAVTFGLNCFAPILLSAKLFKGMCQMGFGRIVNISSIAAKYGGSLDSMHYGSAKRGMEGITKTLARDGARFNVLVNTVRPGVIDTPFHRKFPKDMKRRTELIPLGRMGAASEVAEMVFMLGSDQNTYITNEIITVAGGE